MASEPKHKLLVVTWTDAIQNSNWHREETIDDWMKDNAWLVTSVGFLIRETPDFIVLASSWAENEKQYSGLIKIPRPWVVVIHDWNTRLDASKEAEQAIAEAGKVGQLMNAADASGYVRGLEDAAKACDRHAANMAQHCDFALAEQSRQDALAIRTLISQHQETK